MPSRMDRYYRSEKATPSRTDKNKNLYRTIYDNIDYSNVESIAKNLDTERVQEIDASKIQELLKEKEQTKKSRPSIEKEVESIKKVEPTEENRNYDIRDILIKAKDNRELDEKTPEKIRSIEYNILKNLNIESNKTEEKHIEEQNNLRELNNEDLSLNMFDDLKSINNTMVGNGESIHNILEEVKREEKQKTEEDGMDKTFLTASLGFTDEDFEEEEETPKGNVALKIVIAVLIIAVVAIIALITMKVLSK